MTVVFVLLLLASTVYYYILIQDPLWQDRRELRQRIFSDTDMVTIDQIERFASAEMTMVASGRDAEGRLMYVSVGDVIETFFPDETGMVREAAVEKVRVKYPQATIIRTTPGFWEGEWVWEVFYKIRDDRVVRHQYDYYRMMDGEILETYRLSSS